MKIETGQNIIIIMQNPREKIFGVLDEIRAAGIFVRGIDLNYFDEWTQAINNNEQYLPMQNLFYPMWRIERVSVDESSHGMPSMAEQFEQRTGLKITDF
jgi:hypothetical protein